jgi:hypothetical protein
MTGDGGHETWMTQTLPDGRVCEFIDAQWAPDDGAEPPGTIGVLVTALVDGAIETHRLLWTSERLERAFRESEERS